MNNKLSVLATISLAALIGLSPVTALSDNDKSYGGNEYGRKDDKNKHGDRKDRYGKVKICHVIKKHYIDFKHYKLPYKIYFGRVIKVNHHALKYHLYHGDRVCKPDKRYGKDAYKPNGRGDYAHCGSKDGYDGYRDLSREDREHYGKVHKRKFYSANCYFKVKHRDGHDKDKKYDND